MTTIKQIDYLLETNDLNESIELLKHKYLNLNEYYTEICAGSDTLISLNPFKQIPNLFSFQIMDQYDKSEMIIDNKPHLFKYAQKAFHSIMDSETILVTGESGSGKTMSVNYLMSYFAHITTASNGIESMLLLTNPILEAFGNASTTQNENSSRFGKYIELKFNVNAKCLSTVKLVTCLLEKTRSTINIHNNSVNDRNFHIFYQMIAGANEQERTEWRLLPLKQSDLINKSDISNWILVKKSMQSLQVPHFNDIFKLISCLYHLNQNNNNDSSILLGFETSNELNRYLDFQELNISSNNTVKRICSSKESRSRLEALIKLVYIQLFKWLVNSLNECYLKLINNKTNHLYTNKCIGLLDMYGFEILNVNSFEQLCINYANEKLHQIFVNSHLKLIQEEFSNESIEWKPMLIDTAIDIIETNIFTILNEETMLRRDLLAPNQNQLLEKILQINEMIKQPKQYSTNSFLIKHYAGYVEYSINDFIQKNKDHIPDDLIRFLMKSKNKFLHSILKLNSSNSKKISKTVIDKFRSNLNHLIDDKLNKSHVYYIRCIRTNENQQANMYDSRLIRNQMQACGIHSLINLNKNFNYNHRFDYSKFNSEFYPLILNKSNNQIENTKSIIQQVVFKSNNYSNDYKFGKTKLFMNENILDKLNLKLKLKRDQSVMKIQSMYRMHLTRIEFKKKIKSISTIQNWYRRRLGSFVIKNNCSKITSKKSTTSTSSTISLSSCSSISKNI